MKTIKITIFIVTLLSFANTYAKENNTVTVKLNLLKPGMSILLKYKKLPVYVIHRTSNDIRYLEKKRGKNKLRSRRTKYFITWGYNPSSGCQLVYASSLDKEWWKGHDVYGHGGLVDPCLKVEYDLTGRAFKSYTNSILELPIPSYKFLTGNTLVIGNE